MDEGRGERTMIWSADNINELAGYGINKCKSRGYVVASVTDKHIHLEKDGVSVAPVKKVLAINSLNKGSWEIVEHSWSVDNIHELEGCTIKRGPLNECLVFSVSDTHVKYGPGDYPISSSKISTAIANLNKHNWKITKQATKPEPKIEDFLGRTFYGTNVGTCTQLTFKSVCGSKVAVDTAENGTYVSTVMYGSANVLKRIKEGFYKEIIQPKPVPKIEDLLGKRFHNSKHGHIAQFTLLRVDKEYTVVHLIDDEGGSGDIPLPTEDVLKHIAEGVYVEVKPEDYLPDPEPKPVPKPLNTESPWQRYNPYTEALIFTQEEEPMNRIEIAVDIHKPIQTQTVTTLYGLPLKVVKEVHVLSALNRIKEEHNALRGIHSFQDSPYLVKRIEQLDKDYKAVLSLLENLDK